VKWFPEYNEFKQLILKSSPENHRDKFKPKPNP